MTWATLRPEPGRLDQNLGEWVEPFNGGVDPVHVVQARHVEAEQVGTDHRNQTGLGFTARLPATFGP